VFVADYHALTTHPQPKDLHNTGRYVVAEYLGCGIDPEKSTLYVQSDIPETTELYLFLTMLSYVGELERSTSFKEKVRSQPDNVNAGLLTYPTLMSADILLHKALKVPVGKDQTQHLEFARNFAQRFNNLYEVDYFPLPQAFSFTNELVKVPGLNGRGKMGKSQGEGNAIFLIDEPDVIRKKVMRAVTDTGPTQMNQEKPEPVQNLFKLMQLVSSGETIKHFDEAYNNCTIRYGDLKKQLAEDMIQFTTPIREKVKEYYADSALLHKILFMGEEKARTSAQKTIKEVREIIGFRKF